MLTEKDREFLDEAIETAISSIASGGGPFGALVVCDGRVIARAGNRVVLTADPTAHAEIIAIRDAAAHLGTHVLTSCTLYSSCEPCPMCLGAIYWSGIGRVVYAATRSDAAYAGFSDEAIYRELSLDPEKRSVEFIRSDDNEGRSVFRKWSDYPGRIPY